MEKYFARLSNAAQEEMRKLFGKEAEKLFIASYKEVNFSAFCGIAKRHHCRIERVPYHAEQFIVCKNGKRTIFSVDIFPFVQKETRRGWEYLND